MEQVPWQVIGQAENFRRSRIQLEQQKDQPRKHCDQENDQFSQNCYLPYSIRKFVKDWLHNSNIILQLLYNKNNNSIDLNSYNNSEISSDYNIIWYENETINNCNKF